MSIATIAFRVPGCPIAQPRAKATTINGRARMYEAKKSHAIHVFKAAVKAEAAKAYQGAPIIGPMKLTVQCVFPRPKAIIWKSKPMPRLPHTGRPDIDNLLKGIQDSLNGQLWNDDAQVCLALVTKEYAAGDEQPHCDVTVEIL